MRTPNTVSRSTRGEKMKRASATLALTAAVALGGIAMAAPANAAELVTVGSAASPDGSWNEDNARAAAKVACGTENPVLDTRPGRISYIKYSATWYLSYWLCQGE